jgi:hypothetical protein
MGRCSQPEQRLDNADPLASREMKFETQYRLQIVGESASGRGHGSPTPLPDNLVLQ